MISTRKRLINRQGFTLLELLAVVVILGVVAGIVTVRIFSVSDEAKKKMLVILIKQISIAR